MSIPTHGVYDSLAAAKKAIDDAVKQTESVNKHVLNLKVRTEKGELITAKRVHAGTGKMLFSSETDTQHFYPDEPWIADILRERDEHQQRCAEINAILHPLSTSVGVTWGRVDDRAHYDRVMARFNAAWKDKVALAKKGPQKPKAESDEAA